MRSSRTMRISRPVHMAAGVLMLAIPSSAYALSAKPSNTQSAPNNGTLQIALRNDHVTYGGNLSVTGTAGPGASRQRVELEVQPAGATSWRVLSSTTVSPDGSFRLLAPLRTSGLVRVVPATSAPVRSSIVKPTVSTATTTATTPTVLSPSAAERVTVAAKLRVPNRPVGVLGGRFADVRGTLLPARSGRRVTLLGRSGGHWHKLAGARTGNHGAFDLKLAGGGANGASSQQLKVGFAGDRLNAQTSKGAGRLTMFTSTVASWYYDGGTTACGFHAQYGVANKDLPCGTHVTFSYGGHTVTATVDDRGPYVGGREWDLSQSTAAALGFGGVAAVWSSY